MSYRRGTAAREPDVAATGDQPVGTTLALASRPRSRRFAVALVALLILGGLLVALAVSSRSAAPSTPARSAATGPTTGGAQGVIIGSGPLAWSPPVLVAPETVVVGPGHRSLKLDPTRDFTVVLPEGPVDLGGGVTLDGGRNVVVIGGLITIPPRDRVPSDLARRGLYLKGQRGTVHVEGVHITGDVSDGINLDEREGATVQIENVWIDRVHGGAETHHADVLQTWAGPQVLRIDRLRATTEYQGLFLLPNQLWKAGPPPEEVTIRQSLVTMAPGSGYALWLPERHPGWLDKSGLYVQLPRAKSRRKLTWPDSQLGLRLLDDTIAVTLDQGDPGPSYRSPGYRR